MNGDDLLLDRIARVRAQMASRNVDALLLSVGADLPYLTGYTAMPLERLTMLVLPLEGEATLLVPGLEAARVDERPAVFTMETWGETDDPIERVDRLLGGARRAAIGDQTWAQFLVALLQQRSSLELVRGSEVTAPVRMRKDAAEVEALAAAAAAADAVQQQLRDGTIPLAGRREADVAADIARALLDAGHDVVNFTIVASGPNAASPHHHAGDRVIQTGENVLFDIGGTRRDYCSDITRCVHLGEPPAGFAELYDVLHAAQAAGVAAATVGTPAQDVDRACRQVIDDAGYGEYFIHRTGHGIGIDAHEDPYIVEGNELPLEVGHAFSVEPGIYVPDTWGARLEDIVVVTEDGPRALNQVDHGLAVI
ncbi:MAG: aminopeptidase P family protein [Actinomycetota bacterium]